MINDKYDKRGDASSRGLTDRKIVLAVSVGVVLAVLLFCGQKALDEQAMQLTATAAAGVRRFTYHSKWLRICKVNCADMSIAMGV